MKTPPPRKIIVDTDPSPDDAVAFLMALGSPNELEVAAITTVGGNVPLELTTKNALKALELVGRGDVPVYAGAKGPMVRALETAEYVHGNTGFDGYDLPEPIIAAAKGFAPDKIVELIMANEPGSITICALAPLTNIALAMAKKPAISGRIREIVLMGGARSEGGNVTPAAEFNIYVDPEAAHRVMGSGVPITMIPLDCTHKALTSKARLERLRATGGAHMEAFYHLLTFNKLFDEKKASTDGGPLHDPTVIAYLLQPELFSGRKVNVEISLNDPLTRGMSVVDWWGATDRTPNTLYLDEIDADGYFDLVIERLGRAAR
ncbi:Inosine-uridine preferring nucleoside hydrolase [hydrothermal vent metagenome]|uniref:Inosine-uridine preferring nucleoside hydrolase n=1 Tax=hydrothermal vent metagenome TaxID=652676 RepID=A0A3B0TS04_9ZZZZ